ncbi:MAG TPA: ribose 5-phosphate isomerase B [Parvibaculum sp.]
MDTKNIIIASDHAGFELKEFLKLSLNEYTFIDMGTDSGASVDYPDFGYKAAKALAEGHADFAVVICGSGIGISIAANREPKVRCALCLNEDMARLARQHNNANMLALGARFTKPAEALNLVTAFIGAEFEGGRHEARVEKLGDR